MGKKAQVLFFAGLFTLSVAIAQPAELDSLYRQWELADSDSLRWGALFDLTQYYRQNNSDSALAIAYRSLDFAREHIPRRIPRSLNNIGLVYFERGAFEEATVKYFEALEALKGQDCPPCLATSLGNIGLIFLKKKDYEKAEDYLRQSLEQNRAIPDTFGIIRTLNNLGLLFTDWQKLAEAEAVLGEGVEFSARAGSDDALDMLLNNLGNVRYYQEDYAGALAYYRQSYQVAEKTGRHNNEFLGILNTGWAYLGMKEHAEAIAHFKQAEQKAKEIKNKEYESSTYESLNDAYLALGDFEQAHAYLRKYMVLKDSLEAQLNGQTVAELETRYQTQEKEAQLARQQLKIEQQAQAKNRILVGAGLIVLLFAGLFLYLRSRQQIRRKEAELAASLQQAEAEKLREMDALKSTFFTHISHEFRTPLTLILSPLEQLMSGSLEGDSQKYYRIMQRNGRRLLDLVNQLLDLAHIESGKLKLQAAPGDLARFTGAIAWSFESLANRRQIAFTVQVPEAPFSAYFDCDKVEKIVVNLLSNAFKFTGEEGCVSLKLEQKDGFAQLRITDTGIGIPRDQLPHVFDRFYHSTPSELQAGSGLGLALTRELVELHGGSIDVQSKEGKGTTFTVSLAVAETHFRPEEIVAAQEEMTTKAGIREEAFAAIAPKPDTNRNDVRKEQGAVILVVEDNADVREYIRDQLAGRFEVIVAENGCAGLDLAREKMPDLIITDLMMPEMDGIELARQLKTGSQTSHIPVIMLTARSEQGDKLTGLETGADDYLVKPFDARELLLRIENLIAQRKRLQAYYRERLAFAAPAVEAESMDAAFLRRVREVIVSHMEDEQFSVEELSADMSMSRSQLHRKLSALTGFSASQIIRGMRLEQAKQMLEQKAGTVSEIAYKCGFSSPAYFAKCFKDEFALSPSEV